MATPTTTPTTEIRFFRIILEKTLENGNLTIPKSFTRKYGDALQNPLYLNPPDGTEWKVHWGKHDGRILIERGWKVFATHYCLDHGNVVVFEYSKETSNLEVRMYDMSGLEIDYSHDTVEILNEQPPSKGQKRRLKSSLSSPAFKKLRKSIRTSPNNLEGSHSGETKLEMPSANQVLHGKYNRRKQHSKSLVSPFTATSKALKKAMQFKSKKPNFLVKIKPKNLSGEYKPNLSVLFFRKYFKQSPQNVMLRHGRNSWPVKLIYYAHKSNAIFSAGWLHFARANKLQAGDVCIFELVNRKDIVLDVHFFRG